METEDLKKQWQLLNKQLEKSSRLNIDQVQKIITQRINSIWQRFIVLSFFYVLVCSVALCILILNHGVIAHRLQGTPGVAVLYTTFSLVIVYGIVELFFMIRNNPAEKKLTQAYRQILLSQKKTKIESLIGFLMIVVLIPLMAYWRNIHAQWFYIYTGLCLLISTGICIFVYWYFMKNMKIIHKNLDELREFEKEE